MRLLSTALRAVVVLAALIGLAACGSGARDLNGPTRALGDFYLGHNIVVAPNPTQGPLSRGATEEEWKEILGAEIERRFRRFDGDRMYHIAVSVDGYVLAIPGVPMVASPKSALIFGVNIWDEETRTKLNDEMHRITVLEDVSPETVISSGLTRSKEEQMKALSENAARAIERWLRQNEEWFARPPPQEPRRLDRQTEAELPADPTG